MVGLLNDDFSQIRACLRQAGMLGRGGIKFSRSADLISKATVLGKPQHGANGAADLPDRLSNVRHGATVGRQLRQIGDSPGTCSKWRRCARSGRESRRSPRFAVPSGIERPDGLGTPHRPGAEAKKGLGEPWLAEQLMDPLASHT